MIADRFGAPVTVRVSGVVCLLGGAWFADKLPAIRDVVRPIYRERGIITVPAVDTRRQYALIWPARPMCTHNGLQRDAETQRKQL